VGLAESQARPRLPSGTGEFTGEPDVKALQIRAFGAASKTASGPWLRRGYRTPRLRLPQKPLVSRFLATWVAAESRIYESETATCGTSGSAGQLPRRCHPSGDPAWRARLRSERRSPNQPVMANATSLLGRTRLTDQPVEWTVLAKLSRLDIDNVPALVAFAHRKPVAAGVRPGVAREVKRSVTVRGSRCRSSRRATRRSTRATSSEPTQGRSKRRRARPFRPLASRSASASATSRPSTTAS
jgi:hypothetical protein